jgi:apolipoprotein D and lipocalin family protein
LKQFRKTAISGLLQGVALAALLAAGTNARAQAVTALPSVDLNRFAGAWYEIARLPFKREKECIADVVEVVALADKTGHLQLINSCMTNKGYTDVRNAGIKAEKGSGDAKLKVTYLWPFTEKDWVLAVGQNYEWALVGSPNHKLLLVLSRTRTMSPAVLSGIEQQAAAQGFDPAKIMTTLQMGR